MAVPPVVAVELLARGEGPGQGDPEDEEGGQGEEPHGDGLVSTAGAQMSECWGSGGRHARYIPVSYGG